MPNNRLAVIGECMLELRHRGSDQYEMGIGGDVYNTAVYAVRSGLDVSFLTAVGEDEYSEFLRSSWQAEGVDVSHVRSLSGETPSLTSFVMTTTVSDISITGVPVLLFDAG